MQLTTPLQLVSTSGTLLIPPRVGSNENLWGPLAKTAILLSLNGINTLWFDPPGFEPQWPIELAYLGHSVSSSQAL